MTLIFERFAFILVSVIRMCSKKKSKLIYFKNIYFAFGFIEKPYSHYNGKLSIKLTEYKWCKKCKY